MNLRLARQVLKHLRIRQATSLNPRRRIAARIAARWLEAGIREELDVLWRLSVLEGVVSVPNGSWGRMGRRGLVKARETFSDMGNSIHPDWLSDENTGMYNVLKAKADAAIRSFGVTFAEGEDLLTSMIAGLGVNHDEIEVPPAQTAGKLFANGIMSGVETPKSIAMGPLAKYVGQRASNMAKKTRGETEMPVDEDGEEIPLEEGERNDFDQTSDFDEVREVLGEVVFKHLNLPLSKKIRALMKATWHDSPPMLKWLEIVEEEHRYPTAKEMGILFGANPDKPGQGAVFLSRHWKPRWAKFFKVFWSRPKLLEEIEIYLAKQGIQWEMNKPRDIEMDSLLKPRSDRPRLGSVDFMLDLFARESVL